MQVTNIVVEVQLHNCIALHNFKYLCNTKVSNVFDASKLIIAYL